MTFDSLLLLLLIVVVIPVIVLRLIQSAVHAKEQNNIAMQWFITWVIIMVSLFTFALGYTHFIS